MTEKLKALPELLANNQIEKVLQQLISIFSMTDSELFLDANLLASNYNRLKSDMRRDRGNAEERMIIKNKIYASTLSLIEELKADQSIMDIYIEKEEKLNQASIKRNNLPIPDAKKDVLFQRMSRVKERSLDFRVLWIDDEPHLQRNEIEQLKEIGLEVNVAANEEEANGLIRNFEYQLIISDIARPGREKNGIDFLNELVAEGINIPFVFYITNFDKSKGTPVNAFGITNSLAEFFHLVMDVVGRTG